ncbi:MULTISPECIES: hypothetical protein [unclassified Streptomyces]|uniref:hypothetical protein n=1 Tax=Streptomyces TaxID=1883 RepID=UPI001BEC7FD8|nr:MULTISPECIES: hypothetical protein [unclassified Streptomyces]MBT2406903.1 hypothetical protein [Streptomyces sp. ISL-21]MBT2613062.1 hypothetical protein [Streptomyces sp. ISL-87]MCY0946278.1 hypothetical protein [Streptomyces sp. H34-AA3]
MTVTQADIDALIAAHPQLSENGYGRSAFAPTPVCLDEVLAAHAWIAEQTWLEAPGKSSSYHLKHVMEHATGTYVSNGAFIAAALLHAPGLKVKLDDLNPAIGIKTQE